MRNWFKIAMILPPIDPDCDEGESVMVIIRDQKGRCAIARHYPQEDWWYDYDGMDRRPDDFVPIEWCLIPK